MGVSCKCTPDGESVPSEGRSHIFSLAEESPAFNLEGLGGISKGENADD